MLGSFKGPISPVSHRFAFGLVGARQGASPAQKEKVLSRKKLAHYRHRVIGKVNPGPIFATEGGRSVIRPSQPPSLNRLIICRFLLRPASLDNIMGYTYCHETWLFMMEGSKWLLLRANSN